MKENAKITLHNRKADLDNKSPKNFPINPSQIHRQVGPVAA